MILLILLLLLCAATPAQLVRDTALFTLSLTSGQAGAIRSCDRSDTPGEVLAGPVVMAGRSLLLFSSHGYLLVDSTGAVLDSHRVSSAQSQGLKLAYPVDSVTLVYSQQGQSPGGRAVTILRKRLFDRDPTPIASNEYRWLGAAHAGVYQNIICNPLMHERSVRLNLEPRLIGFTALREGPRWWCIDRNVDLRAPVVLRTADGSGELFPGVFEGEGTKLPAGRAVEPRGTFTGDRGRVYLGVIAQTSTDPPQCMQEIYLCDHAGNVLHADRVLKQTNADIPLSLNSRDGENIMAFVRDATQLAYPPVADGQGRVY